MPDRGIVMNHQKFSSIAHRDHDYCNPISTAKIERVLDLLPLDGTSRVLDLGCGRAELALRIIERFGSTVIAVDHSELMLPRESGPNGRGRSRNFTWKTATSATTRPIPRHSI
jgi:ubiquinone/menaquinone biosynthesis C-methylase UbiE